jgi:membrane associated rhomboid family serine protease
MLLPLNVDVPMTRLPIANWVLMALIAGTSIAAWDAPRLFFDMAGMERVAPPPFPANETRAERLIREIQERAEDAQGVGRQFHPPSSRLPSIALTSSLVHGDWLHLLGNLLFLWVFGNAVNYKLGHLLFLVLYAAGAILGGLAYYWIVPGVPGVGASGAIMCVMGAFLVFFPRNDVTLLTMTYPPVLRSLTADVPSWSAIVFWIGMNVWNLSRTVEHGVGYPAHIAGFVVGFVAAWLLASTRIIRPTRYEQTLLQVLGMDRSDGEA